jgi:hypothetical protein
MPILGTATLLAAKNTSVAFGDHFAEYTRRKASEANAWSFHNTQLKCRIRRK